MPKTITLRLSDQEYNRISQQARYEHRPISNYITASILKQLDAAMYVDAVEEDQITYDARLQAKLKAGHADARKMKGKFVE